MLDESYLLRGLDAMCRAHETDCFADGHRGAAIVSAYFLCRRDGIEEGCSGIMARMVDEHWTHAPLCAPFPKEPAMPELLEDVRAAFLDNVQGLRQAGHNVIFPSLALKVFHHLPETVTPARVAGVRKLIEAFQTIEDLQVTEEDHIPPLGAAPDVADLVLRELLRTMAAFSGRGQGWSGHLLTYAHAILDLRDTGHRDLAHAAEPGFRIYLKRIRMGPNERDRQIPEHPENPLRPHRLAYWQHRQASPPALGHVFKYPYGFYGLLDLVKDEILKQECMQESFRIF